ncbi:MAG: hypothetical protein Rubg2KO_08570 [Rubricoccaceae bacterium]
MPLSPGQSKVFVVSFLAALVGFIVIATVLILQGQDDPRVQARLERIEAEERARAPRLSDAAGGWRDTLDASPDTSSTP